MRILGVHQTDGPWYVIEHRIFDSIGNVAMSLGCSDWRTGRDRGIFCSREKVGCSGLLRRVASLGSRLRWQTCVIFDSRKSER
jgi:hypothetical protein